MSRDSLNLGIACAVFVILLGVYGYWYATVRDLSAQAASLTEQVSAKQADASRAAAARRALESIQGDEDAIAAHFASAENVVAYLEGIEHTGASYGAKVNVGSVSAEQEPRPHLNLTLSIQGSFEAVMRTIGSVEYGPVAETVSKASITAIPAEDGTAKSWTASVTMAAAMAAAEPTSTEP